MFLLLSVRHVGAHPDELQHGVSIQSSINLGKTFPRISRIRVIPSTQILARVFVHLPPLISQLLNGFDFDFDLFWMTWHWKVFSVHDCTQEQNDSQYFSSKVRQCKWPSLSSSRDYHGNLTSHFSSLFRRASLVIIMQNTAECWKTYTKMNGVLTLFVLAESTEVKWYKGLRL